VRLRGDLATFRIRNKNSRDAPHRIHILSKAEVFVCAAQFTIRIAKVEKLQGAVSREFSAFPWMITFHEYLKSMPS